MFSFTTSFAEMSMPLRRFSGSFNDRFMLGLPSSFAIQPSRKTLPLKLFGGYIVHMPALIRTAALALGLDESRPTPLSII